MEIDLKKIRGISKNPVVEKAYKTNGTSMIPRIRDRGKVAERENLQKPLWK